MKVNLCIMPQVLPKLNILLILLGHKITCVAKLGFLEFDFHSEDE